MKTLVFKSNSPLHLNAIHALQKPSASINLIMKTDEDTKSRQKLETETNLLTEQYLLNILLQKSNSGAIGNINKKVNTAFHCIFVFIVQQMHINISQQWYWTVNHTQAPFQSTPYHIISNIYSPNNINQFASSPHITTIVSNSNTKKVHVHDQL